MSNRRNPRDHTPAPPATSNTCTSSEEPARTEALPAQAVADGAAELALDNLRELLTASLQDDKVSGSAAILRAFLEAHARFCADTESSIPPVIAQLHEPPYADELEAADGAPLDEHAVDVFLAALHRMHLPRLH